MKLISKAYKTFNKVVEDLQRNNAYKSKKNDAFERLKKYPQPALTEKQKSEIDRYWAQFGIKFKEYSWFQLYYGVTGIKDPRYIPQEFYFYMILPYYNSKRLLQAYKDKNAFDIFLPSEHFPATVLKRISGDFYDKNGNFLTSNKNDTKITNLLLNYNEVIVKNALDSGRGENVRKYSINGEDDVNRLINEWDTQNYIVQEVIRQHPFFASFNDTSVNIVRINSWYHNGKVIISSPVIRFGMPGYATDCCFINGKEVVHLVGVTKDGYIRDKVVDLNAKVENINCYMTNTTQRIPAWDKIVELIKKDAPLLKHFHLIGWDITVTDKEEPVIIEYNILYPSPYSSQITDGPMWEEYTDELLSFLKNEKNRKHYIPKEFRL